MSHWIDYVVIILMVLSVVAYLVVEFRHNSKKVQFSEYRHTLKVLAEQSPPSPGRELRSSRAGLQP